MPEWGEHGDHRVAVSSHAESLDAFWGRQGYGTMETREGGSGCVWRT